MKSVRVPNLMRNVLIALLFFAVASPAHAASFEVSGWVPYWRAASSTERASDRLHHLTEINPFVYSVRSDGSIIEYTDTTKEPWASLISEARRSKVRVVPTIMWNDAPAMHRILSDPVERAALIADIEARVREKGYDGIDVDFENKWYETRDHFSAFLKELQARFPKKWVMCTIEPRTPLSSRYSGEPPPDAGKYANDYRVIGKYCDRVRIMAYDQGTVDVVLTSAEPTTPYVPVADVRWVEKVVREALPFVPKHKLMIGVPTYGYEFSVTPRADGGFDYTRLWSLNQGYAYELIREYAPHVRRNVAGELSFTYIPKSRDASPRALSVNPVQQTSIAFGAVQPSSVSQARSVAIQETFNIVWWSDARALQDKVALAKKYGLRGISIFKIDGGEDPAVWDILPKLR
ncbi:hypothetical protein KGO06_02060 [Patescibacteria group bacterium]|nr:hypothetical protein [Patescibacteria group bacterium]